MPAGDFEGGAKDLRPDELGHDGRESGGLALGGCLEKGEDVEESEGQKEGLGAWFQINDRQARKSMLLRVRVSVGEEQDDDESYEK